MPLPIVPTRNEWSHLPARDYMQVSEIGFILTVLDTVDPKRMIEFGVNQGNTARTILDNIESVEYYLGVDVPSDYVTPIVTQRMEVPKEPAHLVRDDPRFELFLRYSGHSDNEIVSKKPFDVAFIDGDHSYRGVIVDYRLSRWIVRKGGWIFFHDYNNYSVEVTQVLEDLQQNENRKLFHVNGTWLAYEQL